MILFFQDSQIFNSLMFSCRIKVFILIGVMHVFVTIYCHFCDSFSYLWLYFSQKLTVTFKNIYFYYFYIKLYFTITCFVLFLFTLRQKQTSTSAITPTSCLFHVVTVLCFNTSRQTFADNCKPNNSSHILNRYTFQHCCKKVKITRLLIRKFIKSSFSTLQTHCAV